MSYRASSLANSSTYVEWMWQPDSFHRSRSTEWIRYSDVENCIIEEAFQAKQLHIMLDNYYIDFKNKTQVSKIDSTKQTPVKRTVNKRDDTHIRSERFMSDPICPERSFGRQYGWISPFIKEVRKYLKLEKDQLPSRDAALVPMIVEKAAYGIIEEGRKIGRQSAAKWMAKELMDRKYQGAQEVWKCCVHLYSMEDFLYKKVNDTMRLIGSVDHEEVWRSKVHTLGPFCLLLWDDPINQKPTTKREKKILYRGAKLTEAQIDTYRDLSHRSDEYGSFQAFTSCSRNRTLAEQFCDCNVLFIMEVILAFTADIQDLSEYHGEEEELVFPGVCFTVQRVEFDEMKNKYLIYLNLEQRFNKSAVHEISAKQEQTSMNNDCYRDSYYAARRASIAAAAIDRNYIDRTTCFRDYDLHE